MNPFDLRSEMNAEELLNCEFEDCFRIERKVVEGLNRYER